MAAFGVYADVPQHLYAALADLRAVANRMLRYATFDEIAAVLPPDLLSAYTMTPAEYLKDDHPETLLFSSVEATAAGVTAAMSVLAAPGVRQAGEALRWLVAGSRQRGVTVSATSTGTWGKHVSPVLTSIQLAALDPLLKPSEQLRYQLGSDRPCRPAAGRFGVGMRIRSTPSAIWRGVAIRLAPPHCGERYLRPALSCALLLIGTRLYLPEITERLGLARDKTDVSRFLQLLEAEPSWPVVRIALTRIAEHLGSVEVPIDYGRRRELPYKELLPDETWFRLCRETGVRPGGNRRASLARHWLTERISGRSTAPWATHQSEFRSQLADFPELLTPELLDAMDRVGVTFLEENSVRGEPVTWHPPDGLFDGLDLPGPDPYAIEPPRLHKLIREERMSLGLAASGLGTTIHAVRYMLEERPAPALFLTEHEARANGVQYMNARSQFSPSMLKKLYLDNDHSLRQIARSAGVSRQVTTRLARDCGIPLNPPGRRSQITVDRGWLHEQYVQRRRTLPEIAAEIGTSTSSVARWAKKHSIPLRPRGGASHQRALR
ncbi:MAG: hypothetical protein ACRC20_13940 [Segniliparus sp.]|uniref:hypothetical protein n=1 Tax=Segniliparus sp. TaxID=2804064 RepID=UPI003F3E5682